MYLKLRWLDLLSWQEIKDFDKSEIREVILKISVDILDF